MQYFGFLPFNFNPAKTFIGDTGSNFLGFCLATISIIGTAKTYTIMVIVGPMIVLGLPIFDTLFAIIRRLKKGNSIMVADRGHLHHRLMDLGFSQRQAVITLYCASAFLGIIAVVLMDIDTSIEGILLFGLVFLAIIIFAAINMKNTKKELIDNSEVYLPLIETDSIKMEITLFPDISIEKIISIVKTLNENENVDIIEFKIESDNSKKIKSIKLNEYGNNYDKIAKEILESFKN